jgi:pimeloyl-ACP methyl ester carboxylesterase
MSVAVCGPSSDDAEVTARPPVNGAEYRFLDVNGIRMRVVEQGEGPLVLLVHGFPDTWYSWRDQLPALAAAGYHAVAPDMRGYGATDAPLEIEDYDILDLCGDLVGLIDAMGEEQAVLVAHDWGSLVSRDCVRLEEDRFSAVVNMSVSFSSIGGGSRAPSGGRGGGRATPPTENPQRRFSYIPYLQELDASGQGVAEAELDADPRGFLSRLYVFWGDPTGATVLAPEVTDPLRSAGGWIPRIAEPTVFPAWLSSRELDYYVEEFTRSGFRGGANYYRNMPRNGGLTPELRTMPVSQPAMLIAGETDFVIGGATEEALAARLSEAVPDLRVHVIPGAGHWVQQEKPQEVNRVLLEFLAELPPR